MSRARYVPLLVEKSQSVSDDKWLNYHKAKTAHNEMMFSENINVVMVLLTLPVMSLGFKLCRNRPLRNLLLNK